MNAVTFYQSSIGKKWVVALTGLVLMGYVIAHLIGNLQMFLGRAQINQYGDFLHSHPILLWLARIVLLVCVFVHIIATIQITIENRAARPDRYAVKRQRAATSASKTMIISGLIVLCFIIYHLLHFTAQVTNPEFRTLTDTAGRHDVYEMVIRGFQNPYATGFYVLGMFLLCMHLSHGFQSFLQTMGLRNHRYDSAIGLGSSLLAWLIFAGYVSIPFAVIFGVLK